MKHIDSVRAGIRKKLEALTEETTRLRKVLSALDTFDSIQIRRKRKGKKEEPEKEHRVRRVRYKATCLRCGNVFTTKRTPNGRNPDRNPKFCHKPCNTSMYLREKRKGEAREKERASRRGTTLLPGDALSAPISH